MYVGGHFFPSQPARRGYEQWQSGFNETVLGSKCGALDATVHCLSVQVPVRQRAPAGCGFGLQLF